MKTIEVGGEFFESEFARSFSKMVLDHDAAENLAQPRFGSFTFSNEAGEEYEVNFRVEGWQLSGPSPANRATEGSKV